MNRLAPTAEIHFENIAVRPVQIRAWNLPTRETKISHHSKNWPGGDSCELDAIDPNVLRDLVRNCIERHLPAAELARLQAIEAEERRTMMEFLAAWRENKS